MNTFYMNTKRVFDNKQEADAYYNDLGVKWDPLETLTIREAQTEESFEEFKTRIEKVIDDADR